jgi:hypothetical protein
MSGRFTTRELERALLRKGFVCTSGGKHERLTLQIADERTSIQTLISRASYTIDDSLASRIAYQLRMPNINYLRLFVDCQISAADYVQTLSDRGVL